MEEGFDWVPFYEEMAGALLVYRDRQPELVHILNAAEVGGLADQNPRKQTISLTEIDPLTFIAMVNKQSHDERKRILKVVKEQLGIKTPIPSKYLGIPTTNSRQSWLFPYKFERKAGDVGKLWDLFEAVMSGHPLSDDVMASAQSVKFAGHAKLTQAIFRAAPSRYFPIDGQTCRYLFKLQIPHEFRSATELQSIGARLAQKVDMPFYVQSHLAWQQNRVCVLSAEEIYQREVRRYAAKAHAVSENPGGDRIPRFKPKKGVSNNPSYERNAKIAGSALMLAAYKCEIDPSHVSFTANVGGKSYLEAHHLIPFSNQRFYPVSLDVLANVVALCPNCHRLLHHGTPQEKAPHIRALLAARAQRLEQKELFITNSELAKLYKHELLEEDS